MSISRADGKVTIECDKCHTRVSGTEETYNKVAWDAKFVLNRGRKYEHLCYDCLPKDKQRANDFVHTHFNF